MRAGCAVFPLVLYILVAAAPAAGQEPAQAAATCTGCHGSVIADKGSALNHGDVGTCLACHHIGFTNEPATAVARRVEACINCHAETRPSHFGAAGDAAPTCTSCHTIHGDADPRATERALSERCATCHTSRHALHETAGVDAPLCTECHVSHAAGAPTREADISGRCGECHEGIHPLHADVPDGFTCTTCHSAYPQPADTTAQSRSETCDACHADLAPAHASAAGKAPVCLECHSFGAPAPAAASGRLMSAECGECHGDEWNAVTSGGHRDGLAENPNRDLPDCLTCHWSHVEPGDVRGDIRLAATVQCIECHSRPELIERYGLPDNVSATYTDDFHGATVRFLWNHAGGGNLPAVLVCSDCHGAHDVGWNDSSTVAAVCTTCHEQSGERLAGAWLGHAPVGPRNKAIVWFVRVLYYLLIPFMLGGLFLNIVFDLAEQRRQGARMLKTPGAKRLGAWLRREPFPVEETVIRFSSIERIEHLGSMVTFIMLVVTGLPQTRPDRPIANAIIEVFGSITSTRILHRVAGFLFVALMLMHVTRAIVKAIRTRHMPVMAVRRKDFGDLLQMFRHFLRRAPRPRFGKFDLASKFEYWGLFLGGLVMSVTGLLLVFPELVTRFLPGEVVAAGRVMHGLEATFAVLVVVLWHSYGVILRPEIFPLDTSIFSGKMSVERLREEHPLEYERLFPERTDADAAGL